MSTSWGAALISIIAHARSGAMDRADRLFGEAGLNDVADDPAVLSVKGRLLKDHALAASGWKRRLLYREAAEAYARAAEIGGATYRSSTRPRSPCWPGSSGRRTLARGILGGSTAKPAKRHTGARRRARRRSCCSAKSNRRRPVCGKRSAWPPPPMRITLRRCVSWGSSSMNSKRTNWLDAFRPPRSLHFAGHMAVSPARNALENEIRKTIQAERIGFGYGALAAGADIVIAEALLEAGAELHLVLPAATAPFRDVSVASLGGDWARRFDAIIHRANSIRIMGKQSEAFWALEITLAAEIAMGNAVMQAEFL